MNARMVKRVMVVAAAAFLGCGGGGGSSTTPVTPSSAPPSGPQTVTVMVGPNGSMSFSPDSVSINAGDTVHWMWDSTGLPHTVTSGTAPNADGKFCSAPGAPSVAACSGAGYAATAPHAYDFTFASAGTFPYFCEVHGAMMSGTVTVH